MSATFCRFCGVRHEGEPVLCSACGQTDPAGAADATKATPLVRSPVELLSVHRGDRLREELQLGPGESALVLTRGHGAGSVVRLGDEVVTIGRHPGATILLDDVSVSRRHAEIRPSMEGYRLIDVGSLNGTYLNEDRIDQAPLVQGDDLQIGLFKLCFLHRPTATRSATRPSPDQA